MFLKEVNKFKQTVEKSMYSFFKMNPEEIENNMRVIEQVYKNRYNLDMINFRDIAPECRDDVLRYRTLKYFFTAWKKITELEIFLNVGEENAAERIYSN